MKYLFYLLLIIFSSCTQYKPKNSNTKNESIKPPVVVYVTPKIVMLDTCPLPEKINVPTSITGRTATRNQKKFSLKPPSVNPASPVSSFQNFTTDDGLPFDNILGTYADKKGNIWFATNAGLSRYDGKTFTNFDTRHGLPSNYVDCVCEDKDGYIWIGTINGLCRYDGRTFKQYFQTKTKDYNYIFSMTLDKAGKLWITTWGSGVLCYDGKIFKKYTKKDGLVDNDIVSCAEDKNGNMWFGSFHNSGISRFNGKSFTNYTTSDGLAGNYVSSIICDKAGDIWMGTMFGLSRYNGKSFTNYTVANGLSNNYILSLAEDWDGNIWVNCMKGLLCYNGKSFTNYGPAQGLANNNISNITFDRNGNMWLGSFKAGAFRFAGKALTAYKEEQGIISNYVNGIAEDNKGNLWFATNRGISRLDSNKNYFTNYDVHQGTSDSMLMSVIEDRAGNMWFTTYGLNGVNCFDGKSFTNYSDKQGIPGQTINQAYEDKKGNIWFATADGATCFNGKSATTYKIKNGQIRFNVGNLVEDKQGEIWLATQSGLYKLDSTRTKMSNYRMEQGLPDTIVGSVFIDKHNNLWFGVGNSIGRYDGKTFAFFDKSDGLCEEGVQAIKEDKQGIIWAGCNKGLSGIRFKSKKNKNEIIDGNNSLSNEELLKKYELLTENFNYTNGYDIKYIESMYIDKKDVIWMGASTKLMVFDYSLIHKNMKPLQTFIKNVKINNQVISWNTLKMAATDKNDSSVTSPNITEEVLLFGDVLSKAKRDSMRKDFGDIKFSGFVPKTSIPENLKLPYSFNNITFDFVAAESDRPYMVRYRYMLEGYDKDWSSVSDKTIANFGNIGEGSYTFKVKALGPNGVWSEPLLYTFKVLPPWYRTWWAYVMYALTLVGAFWTFIKWREKSLRKENIKLEQKVDLRTRELKEEKDVSESLLLNILPSEVAEELKAKGSAEAKLFDDVTVLFTDFKGFTLLSEQLSPKELVGELDTCFKAFDEIIGKYNIEKIKTVGDAYLAAAGLPLANSSHAKDMVNAAIEIRNFIQNRRKEMGAKTFEVRIGLHSGHVVAGIVGVKKFAYDIWGDTVNIAARMEQNGETEKVNISEATYQLVKDEFNCFYRGEISAKNKGNLRMYYVEEKTTA